MRPNHIFNEIRQIKIRPSVIITMTTIRPSRNNCVLLTAMHLKAIWEETEDEGRRDTEKDSEGLTMIDKHS